MANTAIRRERIKLTKPGWLDNLTGTEGAEDSELKKKDPIEAADSGFWFIPQRIDRKLINILTVSQLTSMKELSFLTLQYGNAFHDAPRR
ncbi:hypothetical protein, partial [Pseudomonas syringae]